MKRHSPVRRPRAAYAPPADVDQHERKLAVQPPHKREPPAAVGRQQHHPVRAERVVSPRQLGRELSVVVDLAVEERHDAAAARVVAADKRLEREGAGHRQQVVQERPAAVARARHAALSRAPHVGRVRPAPPLHLVGERERLRRVPAGDVV
eukprot:3112628-Prymnesium_polylepis.1